MTTVQSTSAASSSETFWSITLGCLMAAIIISTAIANILICFAFCMVRMLRKPQHYLVVSLAVTDLGVAILVSIRYGIEFS